LKVNAMAYMLVLAMAVPLLQAQLEVVIGDAAQTQMLMHAYCCSSSTVCVLTA
jgi:hypothetical protein